MSDMEEIELSETELAEAKMNAAKEALLSSIERGRVTDHEQYQRLVKRVKKAEQEFMNAVRKLDR